MLKLFCSLLLLPFFGTLYFSSICVAQNIDTVQRDYLKFVEHNNTKILKGKVIGLSDSMRHQIRYVDVRIQSFDVEDEYNRSYPIKPDGSFEVTLDYYIPFQELSVEIGDYSSTFFVLDSVAVLLDFTEFNKNGEPKIQFTGDHANMSKFLSAYTSALTEYKSNLDDYSTIEKLMDDGADSVVFFEAISKWKINLASFNKSYLEENRAPSHIEQVVELSNEAFFLSYILRYYWLTDQVIPSYLWQRINEFQPELLISTVNRFYYYLSCYMRSSWERDRSEPSVGMLIEEILASNKLTNQEVDQLKHTKTLYNQYLQDKDIESYSGYIEDLNDNIQILNDQHKIFLQQWIAKWAKDNHQTLWDYLSQRFPSPVGDILIAKSAPRKEQLTGDSLIKKYNDIIPYVKTPLISYFMKSYVKSFQTSLSANNITTVADTQLFEDTDQKLIRLDFDDYAELYYNTDIGGNEILNHLLEKYKGKVLFIDFWATWCIPCYDDFEKARSLKKSLDLSNIVFIYLCNDSEKDQWIGRIRERRLEGIHLHMTKAQRRDLFNRFNFQGYPSYLLVDKSGKIEFNVRWILEDLEKGRVLMEQKAMQPETLN